MCWGGRLCAEAVSSFEGGVTLLCFWAGGGGGEWLVTVGGFRRRRIFANWDSTAGGRCIQRAFCGQEQL